MSSFQRHLGTLLAFACVVLGAAPALAHSAPNDCATTFNLFIPGTWETNETADPAQPVGMLGPIAAAIEHRQGADSESYFTPYMARAFDNGYSYAESKNTALQNARSALSDYHTRCAAANFTITGYSQGADAAGDIAADIGNDRGPVPAEQVLAVGLLSDPGAGTAGTTPVGPRTAGTGIADPRPQGMGKLSGRVTSICDPKDLYCSIQKHANPLLGLIGSVLSKSPTDSPFAAALRSDAKTDLSALPAAVDGLTSILMVSSGIKLSQLRDSARAVEQTIGSLVDLVGSDTAARLSAAATGTPENTAGQVLATAGQANLAGAESTVRAMIRKAAELLNRGVGTLAPNSPDATALKTAAGTLRGNIAPLIEIRTDILGAASDILSAFEPGMLIDQTLAVVAEAAALDIPGIRNQLMLLSQKVAALDAAGAHQIARDLNTRFQPLVELVGAVDLTRVSQVLSTMPDRQGYLRPAAQLAAVLSNVDVPQLAQLVGRLQESAWTILEKLVPPPGRAPDLAGAAAALPALLPLGRSLASMALDLLNQDLPDLTTAPTQTSMGADLFTLIRDGLSAATFFASGAHINYATLIVDTNGRNAIQWLGDWLNVRIGSAR